MRTCRPLARPAFSMVGLLVTMVCIVILFAIGMNAMNKAVTGAGSTKQGTVHSVQDEMMLYALFQSLQADAMNRQGHYLVPSQLESRPDTADDTTANLFSALIMDNQITAQQLVSANEYSGYVEVDFDYDMTKYDPASDVYWDPKFVADLNRLSNTSFAHVPLYGKRFQKRWNSTMSGKFPIVGNRGPKDGVEDPSSWTYGRDGIWGGHVLMADGTIKFISTFTPPEVFFERDGQRYSDNIFKVEDGPDGADAILSFTKKMTREGAELQFD